MSVAVVPRHASDVRPAAAPMGYLPGLDGIRAIAVLAVLLYHSGVPGVPGGFLGVDVFFVLSGFLISSLLLQEIERTSAVSFGQFYLRRARRLLPALLATLALSSVLVLVFARDAAAQFRHDALASLAYGTNWWYVIQDLSYFEAMGRPPMLQHLWSLAVEEQFYLLWPLCLVALYRWRGRPGVGRIALSAALFSTLLMALGSFIWNLPAAGDASRLYFGTDTHAMGLLLGAALATVWRPGALPRNVAAPARVVLWTIALAAVALLLGIFHNVGEASPWLYRGGFLVVSGVTAVIVALAGHPAIGFGRLLAVQPMRYIGERSYGLYLYHWPIFVVTRPGIDLPFEGVPAWIVRMGLTFAVAELSYRYLEVPVRHGALGRTWRRWRERGWAHAGARTAGALAGVAGAVFVTGTALAAIPAPSANDYLGGLTATGQDLTAEPARPKPAVRRTAPPAPQAVGADLTDQPMTGIGDSVMLGASGALESSFDMTVDAAVSRQFPAIVQRVNARLAAGQLQDVVVIHAGTNGTAYWDMLMSTLDELRDRQVVLVTVRTPNSWMDDSNRNIRGMANQFDNVRIADWEAASAGHREYFVYDGTHLTSAGVSAYVQTIRAALKGDGSQSDATG
ncbi:MAG TPA: acyltransferase family protein [Actinomycetota bacterium]|nr:acyltransferase family protein [Actinomycetota bacterium]